MQTDQSGEEYQEFRAIKGFAYKNVRSDFVAITEKNEKQYGRLQLSTQAPKRHFQLLYLWFYWWNSSSKWF